MDETKKALDQLLSNIIGLAADLPGMLRSSRTWAFLITVGLEYYALVQTGLTGWQAILAALAAAIPGTALIFGKSIRGGHPNNGGLPKPEITDIPDELPFRYVGLKPKVKEEDIPIPEPCDIQREYEAWVRKDFEVTKPYQAKKNEAEILFYYEKQLDLARELFKEKRGEYPPAELRDSCETGDWSFEYKAVVRAQRELQQMKDWLVLIKKDKKNSWYFGGIGYLIHGIKWEDIPSWAQINIRCHTKGDPLREKEIPPLIF